ncbi:MAG TPA: class I SAM-dependent methyltransferase, partial [Rhodothermales bacterium]
AESTSNQRRTRPPGTHRMAQHAGLYQRALYYDIALERDVEREADFIVACHSLHRGRPPRSLLDVACGPGYHARALARRGLRVTGIDLYAEMLQLAAERSAAEGVAVDWLVADMRQFTLREPVDMAVCMFDGIDALTDNDDIIRHFQAVAGALVEGGLYLVDCTHPRDCSYDDYGSYQYGGERDGVRVDVVWSTNGPAIDPVTGVAEVEVELRVQQNGTREVIKDVARERCFTAPELALLAQSSSVFRAAGWYGDMSIDQPLDATPRSRRMIALLQRI